MKIFELGFVLKETNGRKMNDRTYDTANTPAQHDLYVMSNGKITTIYALPIDSVVYA